MSKDVKRYESRLTEEQIKAAQLLAVNNFKPKGKGLSPDELVVAKESGQIYLTLDEIAEKSGTNPRQLYRWRNYDDNFIGYVNSLSTNAFMSHLPDIMEKHLDMTLKGQGSMKGIELFYKFGGLLIDKQEVRTEDVGSSDKALEERLAKLKARKQSKESEEGDN